MDGSVVLGQEGNYAPSLGVGDALCSLKSLLSGEEMVFLYLICRRGRIITMSCSRSSTPKTVFLDPNRSLNTPFSSLVYCNSQYD